MNRIEAFLELARTRRSVRRFKPEPVPPEILGKVLEAATLAPSAGNLQDWRFTVALRAETIAAVAAAARAAWEAALASMGEGILSEEMGRYVKNASWFSGAPALVAVSCKKTEAFLQDLAGAQAADVAGRRASAAMAAQNFALAAHAAGLGTCCLTAPLLAQDGIRKILGIERRGDLVCLLAVGWPAETPEAPARKTVGEVARFIDEP